MYGKNVIFYVHCIFAILFQLSPSVHAFANLDYLLGMCLHALSKYNAYSHAYSLNKKPVGPLIDWLIDSLNNIVQMVA